MLRGQKWPQKPLPRLIPYSRYYSLVTFKTKCDQFSPVAKWSTLLKFWVTLGNLSSAKNLDTLTYLLHNILSRATFPWAQSYGGVRTWVEGSQRTAHLIGLISTKTGWAWHVTILWTQYIIFPVHVPFQLWGKNVDTHKNEVFLWESDFPACSYGNLFLLHFLAHKYPWTHNHTGAVIIYGRGGKNFSASKLWEGQNFSANL